MGGFLKLILASASPQRRILLRALKVPFKVVPSRVSERSSVKDPRRLVSLLAERKARSVARGRAGLVLGADTVVVCRGKILGKPRDLKDSARILSLLNGTWHRVYTGVALVDAGTGKAWKAVVASKVKARKLSPERILSMAGRHMDKAGSYAVQDGKDPFISRIAGPYDNVVGLPLAAVRALLKRALA